MNAVRSPLTRPPRRFDRPQSVIALLIGALLALAACGGDDGGTLGGDRGSSEPGDTNGGATDTGIDDPSDSEGTEPDATDRTDAGPGDSDAASSDSGDQRRPDGGCPEDSCHSGQNRCNDQGQVQTCINTSDGCGQWSPPTSCDDGMVCRLGTCEETTACDADDLRCSTNAGCQVDDSAEDGYTCECRSAYTDYLDDGTVCYNAETHAVVEAGSFQMGSPPGETGRGDDESRHEVTLQHPYLIDASELLRTDWGPHFSPPSSSCDAPTCPVTNVSWWGALRYANELSDRDQLENCYNLQSCSGTPGDDFSCSSVDFEGLECEGWRLPTEAEWEFAARAGTSTATYNGEIDDPETDPTVGDIAWYQSNSDGTGHRQGGKSGNDYGLFDMSGNVAEWVWDRYAPYPTGPVTDPTGPSSGNERVVRGGHWDSSAAECRSAARASETPDTRSDQLGFRLVRTLPSN